MPPVRFGSDKTKEHIMFKLPNIQETEKIVKELRESTQIT